MDNIGEWVTGKRSDLFQGIVRRHGMLRKFSPALLDAFLGRTIDEYPGNARLIQTIKGIFLAGKWWLVFDILETALDMQDVMDFAGEFGIALKEEQWRKTGKAEALLALVTCSGIADMAGSWGS